LRGKIGVAGVAEPADAARFAGEQAMGRLIGPQNRPLSADA
jgi:hypothetical protein